ncbi:MAG TPA: CYTH domain-containing protein, partial [Candidatus Limnocylindrales bacterium]|nr:CYTH domain-containing protein [Candidatus Limnocylindrales bacterium]
MTEGLAPAPVEVELKYRMRSVGPGERLLASGELAGLSALGPAVDVLNEDRYLDTPDAALAAAGYAGRLRSADDGTVITLKGLRRLDEGGAAHRREELEGPADPTQPPAAWPASAARDRVIEIAGDRPLEELVTVRQLRHKRLFGAEGTVVELSLDDVEVVADGRVIDRFAELEAELREGEEAALGPLADLLGGIEELVPAATSKLDRAMDAVHRERAVAPDAAGATERATGDAAGNEREDASDHVAKLDDEGVGTTVAVVAAPTGTSADADGDLAIDEAPTVADELAADLEVASDELDDEGEDEADEDLDTEAGDDPLLAIDSEPDPFAVDAIEPVPVAAAAAAPRAEPPPAKAPDADAAATPKPEPRLTAGKTPGVLTDDHLAEAGRKVLRFHLARMVAREPG